MTIKPRPESGPPEERAAAFDHYVFDTHGRPITPTLLGNGNRIMFVAVGRAFAATSRNPVASFDVGFGENLDPTTKTDVHQTIHAYFTIGLDPRDVIALGGAHQKFSDCKDLTDDMHLGFIRVLARTGKQWSPYFERADRPGLAALQEVINFRYGLTSPKDQKNARLLYFPDQHSASRLPNSAWTQQFIVAAIDAHRKKPFQSQTDLISFAKRYPDVTQAEVHSNFVYLNVGDTRLCLKGRLATDWHYHSPQRYSRKSYASYFSDLQRSVSARWDRHAALSGRPPRRRQHVWLDLFPFEPPAGLVVLPYRQPPKPTKEEFIKMLALGGKAPSAEPEPNIEILIARLHKAVSQGEAKVPKTATEIQKNLGRVTADFPSIISWSDDDDTNRKRLALEAKAVERAKTLAAYQELQCLIRAVNAHVAELLEREAEQERVKDREIDR